MDKKIDIKDIIPGKVYSFWDDGKSGASRQYLAMVTRILSIEDIKHKDIFGIGITIDDEVEDQEQRVEHVHKVYDYWETAVKEHKYLDGSQLYDDDAEFIIECAIPDYDAHLIYFAPCWNGTGLFSFEIQDSWQCGLLDVYNRRAEYLRDDLKEKLKLNML